MPLANKAYVRIKSIVEEHINVIVKYVNVHVLFVSQ